MLITRLHKFLAPELAPEKYPFSAKGISHIEP